MTADDPLALQHHRLAELATLEAAIRTTLRSLHVTYPILNPREHDEHCELAAARALAGLCDELLGSLDVLRRYASARLMTLQHPEQIAWPF